VLITRESGLERAAFFLFTAEAQRPQRISQIGLDQKFKIRKLKISDF